MSSSSIAPTDVRPPLFPAERARPPRARISSRLWPARLTNYFLFGDCLTNPEHGRRARLVTWFGLLGFVFGSFYASFYVAIGHHWGVAIVAVCSLGFLSAPFLMRAFRSVTLGGNFLAAIMTLGFTGLCYVEGGLRGHAVAWLASVPLCALLLVGKRAAGVWVIVSFAAAATVIGADISEIRLPLKYDPVWRPLVDSAGYLGLIAFMFGLGLIFENSREEAFGKMTGALQDLEASNEKLSVLNQEKNDFLGIAAHDLRNPLTIIISYAELLREGGHLEMTPKLAQAIYEAGSRMRDLISNLLDANAIDEGNISCKIERCEVAELVAQSVEQNQLNAQRKGTEFRTSLPADLCVLTDRSTAAQILDNLISNALKYAPPQTCVFVNARREGEEAVIAVKDEGPGISAEDQQKLFGKFAKLTARPTGGESSTGLGLSIVKRLAAAVHGSVECQSVLGEGATFSVRLPIAPES
jgi:signal transduction histidine kinase